MKPPFDIAADLDTPVSAYMKLKPFRPRELRARVEALLRRSRPGDAPAATAGPPVPQQGSVGPSFPGTKPVTSAIPTAPVIPGTPVIPSPSVIPAPAPPEPAATVVSGASADDDWLVHRELRLHPESRIVTLDGDELDLTRTEFDLLATLMESKRRVRSKADLTLVLRGESYVTSYYVGDADKRAVEAHMTNLRRKLGESAAHPRFIETVRGVGYRLTSDAP